MGPLCGSSFRTNVDDESAIKLLRGRNLRMTNVTNLLILFIIEVEMTVFYFREAACHTFTATFSYK